MLTDSALRISAVGLLLLQGSTGTVPVRGEPRDVSLVGLIAVPERFEGSRVRLIGLFRFGREETALYPSLDSSELFDRASAVWVELSKQEVVQYAAEGLAEHFVLVEGRFTTREQGHLGGWAGVLTEVTRLERALTRNELRLVTSELERRSKLSTKREER